MDYHPPLGGYGPQRDPGDETPEPTPAPAPASLPRPVPVPPRPVELDDPERRPPTTGELAAAAMRPTWEQMQRDWAQHRPRDAGTKETR